MTPGAHWMALRYEGTFHRGIGCKHLVMRFKSPRNIIYNFYCDLATVNRIISRINDISGSPALFFSAIVFCDYVNKLGSWIIWELRFVNDWYLEAFKNNYLKV